jgi:hypothetical protein
VFSAVALFFVDDCCEQAEKRKLMEEEWAGRSKGKKERGWNEQGKQERQTKKHNFSPQFQKSLLFVFDC